MICHLHVCRLNHAGVQVCPVESLVCEVNCESVGSAHFVHQSHDVTAVHVSSSYPGSTSPFSPVHVPANKNYLLVCKSNKTRMNFTHHHTNKYVLNLAKIAHFQLLSLGRLINNKKTCSINHKDILTKYKKNKQ